MDLFNDEDDGDNPRKYIPIRHLYSSTSPCVVAAASGSSTVMSKKVKAKKIVVHEEAEQEAVGKGETFDSGNEKTCQKPVIEEEAEQEAAGKGESFDSGNEKSCQKPVIVYSRRRKRPCLSRDEQNPPSFFNKVSRQIGLELGGSRDLQVMAEVFDVVRSRSAGELSGSGVAEKKRRKIIDCEFSRLGGGSGPAGCSPQVQLGRESNNGDNAGTRKCIQANGNQKEDCSGLGKLRKWVEMKFEGADPLAFVGLQCKVFWPMDRYWYNGFIKGYNSESQQHQVEYKDGDAQNLTLSNERIKFHISCEEMQRLNLKYNDPTIDRKTSNYDDMLALALSCDDGQDFEPGDIVWAKLPGYSMWPALVIAEENGVLKPHREVKTIRVQFFGTHDFARINLKKVKPFFRGLLSSFHLKCRQARFRRSLEEAKSYLGQQQLCDRMSHFQENDKDGGCGGMNTNEEINSLDDHSSDEGMPRTTKCISACPFEVDDLCVTSLGKVVCDSEFFHNKHFIWPEGYTASRKFISITNPKEPSFYAMEVLRNPKSKSKPLFRVTMDDGEQIDGPSPNSCWDIIYSRIRRNARNGHAAMEECELEKSGSYMFGFLNPEVSQLIQDLPNSRSCSDHVDSHNDLPVGYRAVRVEWKDLDRCNVCHMDEEYEDNLFLQCDKCRMMVHARCYGELEPLDGVLWLCNLCRPGAPMSPPLCCLCPVVGGAIKPTTDGRWAHLTCAMWIPETCLVDIKKMEPIDGLTRINKDRWKLLCSICDVPYGACIQCSNSTCRIAYHPLCARAAGLCVELEDEERLHLMSFDEEDYNCIHLLSYCKKHRQPLNDRSAIAEQQSQTSPLCSTYSPPSNPSGCSRCEPYNFFGRRGQKEPQVLAAASVKRLYVENRPYLVGGYYQNEFGHGPLYNKPQQLMRLPGVSMLKASDESPETISSIVEKYKYMKATCRKRLTFGKSKIHGIGVFAKVKHKAMDMVIEYTGELVRPPIADIREHLIYNSLVGAGTYMFRVDNERVIDATRAGSIAHLINHSCEPNCYSRVITIEGDEHIIICAKRDINEWEELTYDYRFFSIDEQLACYCGFSRCRGVVNDIEAEERIARLWVPRSELIHWNAE